MIDKCISCSRVREVEVSQSPTMYPVSHRYCEECCSNRSENIYYLILELVDNYEEASKLNVSGCIDGIYIPMESLKKIYRYISAQLTIKAIIEG